MVPDCEANVSVHWPHANAAGSGPGLRMTETGNTGEWPAVVTVVTVVTGTSDTQGQEQSWCEYQCGIKLADILSWCFVT